MVTGKVEWYRTTVYLSGWDDGEQQYFLYGMNVHIAKSQEPKQNNMIKVKSTKK